MSASTALNCASTVTAMTEPPRPPGEGNPYDPTAPFNPYAANDPAAGSAPPPPPPGYGPPPTSGAGYGPPPTSGAGYGPPPSSGAGYGPPPSAYQPPPGYDAPPPGYGGPPPGYGAPPPGYGGAPTQDDKTWILLAHFGGAGGALLGTGLAGWIVPLIALLAKGGQSPVVRAEAVKALNFQILWGIVALIGWITVCVFIGGIIIPVAVLIQVVFGVIAGIKATNNQPYNYPMTVNLIK